MRTLNYHIVDVFSQGKYSGNQLAVFTNAEDLSSEDMQKIAKEINFSETTFITGKKDKHSFDVRIFTPNEEVPFAGHPTIGTASVIKENLVESTIDQLYLQMKHGEIPVTFDHEENIIWMKQSEPTFGKILEAEQLANVLQIDVDLIDESFPIQEVSTGLPVILVPLKSLEAVKKANLHKEKYYQLIENTEAKAVMVFCKESYHADNHFNVRDFADYFGVPEDAATGSANGCLASYLIKYNYCNSDDINIRVEQGYEISRPSLLFLKANSDEEKINVSVGGRVENIAYGEWYR